LYDVAPSLKGISVDLSHTPSRASVSCHIGDGELDGALKGSDIVLIPAGVPRKPGMTRDDLFNTNASIAANIASAIADHCPNAFICVITNPLNSTVPIIAEILKRKNVYDPKRLFGVTSLDMFRASRFAFDAFREANPNKADKLNGIVPLAVLRPVVVGGHAGTTIVPLFEPSIPQDKIPELTKRVQFGGDEVVQAKAGAGSATLSMAQAAAYFLNTLHIGLSTGVSTNAYVQCDVSGDPAVPFFASTIRIGKDGIVSAALPENLNEYQKGLIKAALPELRDAIAKGVSFGQSYKL